MPILLRRSPRDLPRSAARFALGCLAAALPWILAGAGGDAARDSLPAAWVPLPDTPVYAPTSAEQLRVREEIAAFESDWSRRHLDALGERLGPGFRLRVDSIRDGFFARGEMEFPWEQLLERLRAAPSGPEDRAERESLRDIRLLFAGPDACTVFYRFGDPTGRLGETALVLADLALLPRGWTWLGMRQIRAPVRDPSAGLEDPLETVARTEALSRADLLLARMWDLRGRGEVKAVARVLDEDFQATLSSPRQKPQERTWRARGFLEVLQRVLEALSPRSPSWTVEDSIFLPRGEDGIGVFQSVRYEDDTSQARIFILTTLHETYRDGWRVTRWFERVVP